MDELALRTKYFDSLNLVDSLLSNSVSVLTSLSDEDLIELNDRIKELAESLWKLRCAICHEVKRRITERGGSKIDMESVAGRMGMSLRTFYRYAQVWEQFFLSDHDRYFCEGFDNALDWFTRALSAADPVQAIEYAGQRWEELGGEYYPRDFSRELARQLKPASDWMPLVMVVPRERYREIESKLAALASRHGYDLRFVSRAYGQVLEKLLDGSVG